jgi:hypothetical protein
MPESIPRLIGIGKEDDSIVPKGIELGDIQHGETT